jgi:hypothetical protein
MMRVAVNSSLPVEIIQKNGGSAPWRDQIVDAHGNQINADAVNASINGVHAAWCQHRP